MPKNTLNVPVLVFSSLAAISGCRATQQTTPPVASPQAAPTASATPTEPAPAPPDAAPVAVDETPATPKTVTVTVRATSGSKLTGTATLTEVADGVKVVLSVAHVAPGDHGAHIHEKGDCSAADGTSAGGHLNPAGNPHALPPTTPRHLGDLGNITVGADGKGTLEIVAPGANLEEGSPNSFLHRAIIIHAKKDDGGQPTGNAGARIGCGEIG